MTTQRPSVLVVTDLEPNEIFFVVGVMGALGTSPRIQLAAQEAVSFDTACDVISQNSGVAVVVLVGFDTMTAAIAASLRELRPAMKIVSFPVIGTHFTISLPHPDRPTVLGILDHPVTVASLKVMLPSPESSQEFVATIDLLLDEPHASEVAALGGKVVPLRRQVTNPLKASEVGEANSTITATLLDEALKWVEEAVKSLREIWDENGDVQPARLLNRDWLTWIAGIENAPTEAADGAFEVFKTELAKPAARATPLGRIATLLGDNEVALKLLLVVLSAEFDIRFPRIFGAMHDDYGRRYPSVVLASALVAAATAKARPFDIRLAISRLEDLRNYGIIAGINAQSIASAETGLFIEPAMLDWILTGDARNLLQDPAFAPLLGDVPENGGHLYPLNRRVRVCDAANTALNSARCHSAVLLSGSEPGWIQADANAVAESEIRIVPRDGTEGAIGKLVQSLRLIGRPLIMDLTVGKGTAMSLWQALLPHLTPSPSPPLILTQEPAALLAAAPRAALAVVHLPDVILRDRVEAIDNLTQCGDHGLVRDLARQFRLPFDHFHDALSLAEAAASKSGRDKPNAEDWRVGFRGAAGAHLPALARRVEPRLHPDPVKEPLDLVVLPRPLRERLEAIVDHVRFSDKVLVEWEFGQRLQARGVSALFSGDSGTGKTLAAHAIASTLNADLYVVDLARIISKYIGETEKNLDVVFNEAERAGAVLLFDEADALFGKRSEVRDAHDRYANIEVAYLLQRMELFDGLAILTTNYPDNVDPAFARRLRFSVKFPRPNAQARKEIWDLSIPPDYREPPGLDLCFFAHRFELTGGSIRQIAIHAAMAAARDSTKIALKHVLEATRNELLRTGAHGEIGQLSQLEKVA